MSRAIVVTGTDTDVGKTVVSAGLAAVIPDARYWKPVQAGTDSDFGPGTDRQRVAVLSGLADDRLLPEAYCLTTPASPHLAAKLDGVKIDLERLVIPVADGPLIVEGAGGVLVPITETRTMADLFARWAKPTILVARTKLGTINHTLASIEVMRARKIPVGGVIFVGEAHPENERIIPLMGDVAHLGRLPMVEPLNHETLRAAMLAHIDLNAIKSLIA